MEGSSSANMEHEEVVQEHLEEVEVEQEQKQQLQHIEEEQSRLSSTCPPITPPISIKRKARGPTQMDHINKRSSKGIRETVQFNSRGQPIGGTAYAYASFICCTVRRLVPISVTDWRLVSPEVKDAIWEIVKSAFAVSDKCKKQALLGAGEQWRKWKSELARKYILPNFNDPSRLNMVPQLYSSFIDQDTWNQFVQYRLSPDFEAKHIKGQMARAQNHMQHHLSRVGYARLEANEQKKARTTEPIDRALLWKMAHSKGRNSQTFTNETTAAIASRIEELTQESATAGTLSSTATKGDILYRAMGNKDEHPGRVRGLGRGIVPSKFFPKQKTPTLQELEEWKKQTVVEIYSKVKDQLLKELQGGKRTSYQDVDPQTQPQVQVQPPQSDNSYTLSPPSDKEVVEQVLEGDVPISEVGQCMLQLHTFENYVAVATLYEVQPMTSTTLHGKLMPPHTKCVCITATIQPDAPLPFPIQGDNIETIGDAIGYHVSWPEELIKPMISNSKITRSSTRNN